MLEGTGLSPLEDKEQFTQDALESHCALDLLELAMSYEFLLPTEILKKAALKRIRDCIKWSFVIALGVFALLEVSLMLNGAWDGAGQAVSMLLFCFLLTVPGYVIQLIICKIYTRNLPYKIILCPGKLIVSEDSFFVQQIKNIQASPVRVYNPYSPGIFRKLTVCTERGKKTYTIDFRAVGAEIRWEEYPQFADALYHWGKANNVPVVFAYMD